MIKKKRIDLLLVELGLAPSRERAQSLIMAGKVLANEQKVKKASESFLPEVILRILGQDHPFVGRGGVKLAHILQTFVIDVQNKICVDMGASTGGFTDCLLQAGAKKVYAIDVGTNQLAWKLRQDKRVVVNENTHANDVMITMFKEPIDFVCMDVSFISVTKILPHLFKHIPGAWDLIILIKPQFELSKAEVEKGGVIKDPAKQQQACEKIQSFLQEFHFSDTMKLTPSPITGDKGNQEFLLYAKRHQDFLSVLVVA